jgi:methyl-accepting chemotaxis protein
MRLEHKLGCSTGLLIGAMLLSAATASREIEHANQLSKALLSQRLPIVRDVNELHLAMIKSVQALENEILLGFTVDLEQRFHANRSERLDQANAALRRLRTTVAAFPTDKDAARLDEIDLQMIAIRSLEEQAEQANSGHTSQGTAVAYHLLSGDLDKLTVSLDGHLSALVESQTNETDTEVARLQVANRRVVNVLWLATLAGALVGGLFSAVLGRRIVRALHLVSKRADAISTGDLTGSALQLESDDQIGSLAAAMNRMQASLRTIIGTVADTAGTLTGSAATMRSASDQIHRRIDQQSQQTQQAATAMQEMSASIAEVSRHTQSAAETARSAAETARAGGSTVKLMLASMHSIALAVADAAATVRLLGEDSRRISQIVTVIDEIARKTNLLALNAAIEAARAGDQGRGFAVVAGEVRRLAESTAQATGEIAAMIREIQARTRTAIASMDSGTGTVLQGVVTTNQAGEALEKIIGIAERVDRMITQIAIAASQQAAAADQSSSSLDSINMLSNENLKEMATAAAGIESLRETAVNLELQVDRFQVQEQLICQIL